MNENRPPFFLELEGYEAGHSAAESLTNSLQTAQCATENGQTWDHRSGLRIACPIAGDAHADVPFALVNGGKEPITVNHFSRCIRLAMGTARPQDMLLAGRFPCRRPTGGLPECCFPPCASRSAQAGFAVVSYCLPFTAPAQKRPSPTYRGRCAPR